MTDNELKKWNKEAEDRIIKALEGCVANDILQQHCENCDYRKHGNECMNVLLDQVVDLINRQKAEIERLEEKIYEKGLL